MTLLLVREVIAKCHSGVLPCVRGTRSSGTKLAQASDGVDGGEGQFEGGKHQVKWSFDTGSDIFHACHEFQAGQRAQGTFDDTQG